MVYQLEKKVQKVCLQRQIQDFLCGGEDIGIALSPFSSVFSKCSKFWGDTSRYSHWICPCKPVSMNSASAPTAIEKQMNPVLLFPILHLGPKLEETGPDRLGQT